MNNARKPARIWMGTIPYSEEYDLHSRLNTVIYAKGQRERGHTTGYEHWQLIVWLGKPQRLSYLTKIFGSGCHWEPTRSEAAEQYVWKLDTAIANTQFEFGTKPLQRNNSKDWEEIRTKAITGQLMDIPADIYVRCYNQLKRIQSDHLQPIALTRTVHVFWGKSGTGKSRRAWDEAGMDAYPKDPRTKFWDGYNGHQHVVIDEFRGGIDISHVLRWLDRYPVIVEIKGSSTVLKAETIWITSNIEPFYWYPDLDMETRTALLRRMQITEFK